MMNRKEIERVSATYTGYSQDEQGLVTVREIALIDQGGNLTVSEEIEEIKGWPTPARRALTRSDGRACGFVGCDMDGSLVVEDSLDE
jgi:hypothetical protein